MTIPKPQKCLSVVMPCYNELETIEECLTNVLLSPWVLEVIVVDDGSKDGTRDVLAKMEDERVKVYLQPRNEGKGSALRKGFSLTQGDFVIVQDADLEYDPCDYERILLPLISGQADVVFGSRFKGSDAHRVLYF